jgi:hypothetical protein
MIPAPDNSDVIKTAKKVFRFDEVLTDWGWEHDVYYSVQSQEYLIVDFPSEGHFFAISRLPEDGDATLTAGSKTYEVNVRTI